MLLKWGNNGFNTNKIAKFKVQGFRVSFVRTEISIYRRNRPRDLASE
jgi:hypothetical protein